ADDPEAIEQVEQVKANASRSNKA
ncbi:MAG: hypothetical protein K0S77_1569, partial [Pseudomonas sp.]|nr:hypothetical protein [Pseudomonas sp.]